jgi:hypothetical protein
MKMVNLSSQMTKCGRQIKFLFLTFTIGKIVARKEVQQQ